MPSSGLASYAQSVEAIDNALLALEWTVQPRHVPPPVREPEPSELGPSIAVVFTSAESTRAALQRASAMASGPDARISLLAMQSVPFPRQLDDTPVSLSWIEGQLCGIANDCRLETSVRIYLCRNRVKTLQTVLQPDSLVVIGCRPRWWPTSEMRLARKLRRLGHLVILAETE
jgi:hypothetical protein